MRFLAFFVFAACGAGLGAQEDTDEGEETPAESEDESEDEEEAYVPLDKLVFVEAHFDGQLGVDGLDGSYTIALSPDGNFVYAASMNDDAVSYFLRDKESGELSYLARVKNGENGVTGLNGARSLVISPSGSHLYVVSMFDDSLVAFGRNLITGDLTFLEKVTDGEAGVDGLDGARSISISPDGLNLYVGGWGDNALTIFGRDVATGAVSFLGRLKNGEDGIDGLDAPHFLTTSPDGKTVYVALWDEDAVSYFSRDASTGLLTYGGKVVDEIGDVNGLKGPRAIACSTDGAYVYVATWNDDAVVVFDRDDEGVLAFNSFATEGLGGVEGMNGPHSLAISAEGDFLYAAAFFDDAVTVFARNPETGKLSYDQSIFNGDALEVGTIKGMNGALTLATSSDGEHVYLGTSNDRSLAVFRRELVVEPPVITLQPTDQSVSAGETAVFNIAAEGVDIGYRWQRDGVELSSEILPVLTLESTQLSQSGQRYRVVAWNAGGSESSVEVTLTVTPAITLEAPDNLTALDVSNTSARLEWTDVNTNETGYEIRRKVASGEFVSLATVFANVESYIDASLAAGTTYIYQVRAKKNSEISLWSNDAVIESFDDPPVGPANLRVVESGYSSVDLRWSDRSAVETGYRIQRRNASEWSGSFVTVGTVEKSVSIFKDRGVDENGTYAYRVQAYNESGSSPYSNTVVATTSDLPVMAISPTTANIPAGESSGNSVLVTAVSAGSEWEAFTEDAWLAIQSPSNGIGFGSNSVSYRALSNETQVERFGTIEIGGLIHTVRQAATQPFLQVSPVDSNFASSGGTVSLSVQSNVVWSAVSDSAWIEIMEGTAGENEGVIRLRVGENLSANRREGLIAVNGFQHNVSQSGQDFSVILSPSNEVFQAAGGQGMFDIESNTDWAVSTNVDWIELLDTLLGVGDGSFNYLVLENETELSRAGRIFVNEAFIDIIQVVGGDGPVAPTETLVGWAGGVGFTHQLAAVGTPALSVDSDWVTVTGYSSSAGTGTLSFDVTENFGMDERIALISVGGQLHAVRQAAKPVVAPELSTFTVGGGVDITVEPVVSLEVVMGEAGDPPAEYRVAENIGFLNKNWIPFESGLSYRLSYNPGVKRVYFQTRNSGGESGIASDVIEYAPLVKPEFLESRFDPVSGFYARLKCEIGESYRLECSPNMEDWETLKEFAGEALIQEIESQTDMVEGCLFFRVVKL